MSVAAHQGNDQTHSEPSNNNLENPFNDSAGSDTSSTEPTLHETDASATTNPPSNTPTVLTVDRNATLTLGTEALIVLDEGLRHRRAASNLCGLLPQLSKTTRAISFYDILWAELVEFEVTIRYARTQGDRQNGSCRVGYINYNVTEKDHLPLARKWVEALMDRAYPPRVQRKKRVKVLVNPFGGQGHAVRLWAREVEPIFAAARCEVDVETTKYRGHAEEIAQKLDVDGVDVVACASGDGLPHEVFNGLAKQERPRRALGRVAVTQIPCGSGNGLSMNLTGTTSPSLAAVAIVKGVRSPLDLMAVTQGNKRFYSFLSQAVGIAAECDLGTESLRWMGGIRFTWGFLVRVLGQTVYPAEVSVVVDTNDKREIKEAHRSAILEQRNAVLERRSPEDSRDSEEPENSFELPALRYQTVQDKLSSDFTTTDLPTLGNLYVGGMPWMAGDAPFFPYSLPSDGKMDMLNIDGRIPRATSIKMMMELENGTMMEFPEVNYLKVKAYRVTPRPRPQSRHYIRRRLIDWLGGHANDSHARQEGLISIDGESMPFEPYQVEVVPGLATVLCKRGGLYEYEPAESA